MYGMYLPNYILIYRLTLLVTLTGNCGFSIIQVDKYLQDYEKKIIGRFYEVDCFFILLNADNRKKITGKNTLLLLQSTFY